MSANEPQAGKLFVQRSRHHRSRNSNWTSQRWWSKWIIPTCRLHRKRGENDRADNRLRKFTTSLSWRYRPGMALQRPAIVLPSQRTRRAALQ